MVRHTAQAELGQMAWLDCLLRLQAARGAGDALAFELLDETANTISRWTACESVWIGQAPPQPPLTPVVHGHGSDLGILCETLRPVQEQAHDPSCFHPSGFANWRWTAWNVQSPRLPSPLAGWMTDLGYHTLNVLSRQDAAGYHPCMLLASHDSHHSLGGIQRLALQALASEALALLQCDNALTTSENQPPRTPALPIEPASALTAFEQLHHDIRTPLNAIAAATYLALQTELPARSRRYIEQAAQSVSRVADIVADAVRRMAQEAQSAAGGEMPPEQTSDPTVEARAHQQESPDFSNSELEATLETDVATLTQLLQEHDTNARLLVDTVAQKLRQAGSDQTAERMRILVREYEYDRALHLLEQAVAMTRFHYGAKGALQ